MINGSKYIRRVYLCGVYNNMMGLMMMCALYIFFKRKDNRLFRYSIDTVCNFVVRKMFKTYKYLYPISRFISRTSMIGHHRHVL